jgi:iron complex outermembrane recepter protein
VKQQTRSRFLQNTVLSSIVGVAALSFASGALAQTPPAPQDPDPNASELGEVVVTGTRLRVPEYTEANPVVSLTEENLQQSGITNLTDYLQDVPSLVSSIDLEAGADTSTPGLVGISLLNLRNLGSVRTLTLVNGRRHVAANPGTTAVDTNSIPIALVERIEILTGGASAVYGADGVSGVVNFILKDDFEGVDVRTQYGWSDAGGGYDSLTSFLIGQNFLDDRLNITLAAEYQNSDDIKYYDRSYTTPGNRYIQVANPAELAVPGDDPNIPDQVFLNNIRYIDTTPGGSIYTNFATAPTTSGVSFLGDGTPFIEGTYLGGFTMQGGSGSLLDLFNDDLIPGFERTSLNSTVNFRLAPAFNLFGELKYNLTSSDFVAQPSYDYGLFIDINNPYLPATARADALTPGGLGLSDGGVLVARDNFDYGSQTYNVERETWRGVFGVEGDLTGDLAYELSVVYGRTIQDVFASNVRLNDRYFAATDVVQGPNGPVCRSNITPGAAPVGDVFAQFVFDPAFHGATFTPGANSGCLPVNPFGEGRNSAAAIDWFTTEATQTSEITQTVVNGFITGSTEQWFSLPGGAINFVFGGEYRKEESDFRPSEIEELAESLEYPISTLGRGVRTQGEFDVYEAFTELSVPLLRDLPFVQELRLDGAFRYSDYSTSGETETWNVNGRWQINDTFMIRATQAQAVRAPNINNLFAGNVQTFAALADPCSQNNLQNGENPQLRAQNCATDLTALGVNPATFQNNSSESIGGFIRGNPDLLPEEADTFTLGLVFTPYFIPGLRMSVDYFDIEITDAIQSYSAQTIVNNCYDLPRPNPFCDLIERGTSGGNVGRITTFDQVPGNIASYVTAGYDVRADYLLDPENFGRDWNIGTLQLSFTGNYLKELVFLETSDAPTVDSVGSLGAPEFQVSFDATWRWNDLTVNYGWNWFDKTRRISLNNLRTNLDYVEDRYKFYDPRSTHDFQVRYSIDDRFDIYGGVNNAFDQEPEASSFDYPVSALGRFFYVGLNARLDSIGSALRF